MANSDEEVYGPAAKYSEHKVGEVVTFYLGEEICASEILYVRSPE